MASDMYWALALAAFAAVLLVLRLRSARRDWRRGSEEREGGPFCPQCGLEVSKDNPMVPNVSGRRVGLHGQSRWCQVCERNAEQHVIHRS